jgi:hypothetical protein
LAPGGPGGHNGVRHDGGGGRNRPVHLRRRVISSAAVVPAKPRRSSSIKWHDELLGVTQRLCAQGIEEWSRGLPGLRSPAVGGNPATVDWLLRQSKLRFLARGASLRRAQSFLRVGRGRERLCWPVYGCGGSGGRGHAVHGQTPVVSGSGEVERVRRSTVEVPGDFIGAGVGNSAGSALTRRGARGGARRACSGELRARRTSGSLLLPLFFPLLSGQNVRILP